MAGEESAGDGALARLLARRILIDGPLSVGAFMAEALGHPRFGYYMRRDPFGSGGDFTTAPEISQMFGELVGLWCVDSWARLGGPGPFHLVELGPGRGTLMADALRAAAVLPLFRDNATVHLVETSPALRERQRQTLQPILGDAIQWHDRLEDVPDGPTILIANEFFDALPIRQVQKTNHGWFERLVDLEPDSSDSDPRFRFVLEAFGSSGSRLVPDALRDAPEGSVVEVSPRITGGGPDHRRPAGGGARRGAGHRLRPCRWPGGRRHAAGAAPPRLRARAGGAGRGRPDRACRFRRHRRRGEAGRRPVLRPGGAGGMADPPGHPAEGRRPGGQGQA